MSEVLERVIKEQQEKLDRLEASAQSAHKYAMDNHKILQRAFDFFYRYHLYMVQYGPDRASTDIGKEKIANYHRTFREELKNAGYCIKCGCYDYCQCGDDF